MGSALDACEAPELDAALPRALPARREEPEDDGGPGGIEAGGDEEPPAL